MPRPLGTWSVHSTEMLGSVPACLVCAGRWGQCGQQFLGAPVLPPLLPWLPAQPPLPVLALTQRAGLGQPDLFCLLSGNRLLQRKAGPGQSQSLLIHVHL